MDSSISIILHAYVHYSLSIWKYCRVSERNISEYLDKRETIASWMNHTLTLTKLCLLKNEICCCPVWGQKKILTIFPLFWQYYHLPHNGLPIELLIFVCCGWWIPSQREPWTSWKNEIDIEAIWSMWIQLSLPDTCLLRVSTNTPNSSSKRWLKQIFSKFLYISKLLFIYTSTNVFL